MSFHLSEQKAKMTHIRTHKHLATRLLDVDHPEHQATLAVVSEACAQSGGKFRAAAALLGVPYHTLYNWHRTYRCVAKLPWQIVGRRA
jgi:transcriptional regulator with PAS, ATPase and Fis domain